MKKQIIKSKLLGNCVKLSIFSILFSLLLINSAFSSEKKEKSECYKHMDSLLVYDDIVKVTDFDGYKYSGTLIKVREDSIVIRYIPVKLQQSPVLQSIMINDIAKIECKGIREESVFLSRSFNRLLFFSAATTYAFIHQGKSSDDANDIVNVLANIGIGMLLGEAFNALTIKKMPIDITIQCK